MTKLYHRRNFEQIICEKQLLFDWLFTITVQINLVVVVVEFKNVTIASNFNRILLEETLVREIT